MTELLLNTKALAARRVVVHYLLAYCLWKSIIVNDDIPSFVSALVGPQVAVQSKSWSAHFTAIWARMGSLLEWGQCGSLVTDLSSSSLIVTFLLFEKLRSTVAQASPQEAVRIIGFESIWVIIERFQYSFDAVLIALFLASCRPSAVNQFPIEYFLGNPIVWHSDHVTQSSQLAAAKNPFQCGWGRSPEYLRVCHRSNGVEAATLGNS